MLRGSVHWSRAAVSRSALVTPLSPDPAGCDPYPKPIGGGDTGLGFGLGLGLGLGFGFGLGLSRALELGPGLGTGAGSLATVIVSAGSPHAVGLTAPLWASPE